MIRTLFEAVGLVIVVWRAAIIPVVAIPVSLIGCFLVMGATGLTFNARCRCSASC